jgi:hypothetical protein
MLATAAAEGSDVCSNQLLPLHKDQAEEHGMIQFVARSVIVFARHTTNTVVIYISGYSL